MRDSVCSLSCCVVDRLSLACRVFSSMISCWCLWLFSPLTKSYSLDLSSLSSGIQCACLQMLCHGGYGLVARGAFQVPVIFDLRADVVTVVEGVCCGLGSRWLRLVGPLVSV